jgi:molybdopterin molybdotransferase
MTESDLISVARAIDIIDSIPITPAKAKVRLEQALGMRLAQDIVSDRDYPPLDKSLVDGFAVRCDDVSSTPVDLRVVGEVAAGLQPARSLRAGEAIAVMTGAPMPQGADGVVPVEQTESIDGGAAVRILRAEDPRRFITRRGADCAAGSTVLRSGTRLEAAQLAVAASVGACELDVYAKPRAAVLSTGDELVPVDSRPGPAQIRNSNSIMLGALLRRFGCDVTDLGVARDEPEALGRALKRGLELDLLFVSGGMSMGRYDHVPKLLIELGAALRITKLRIKPGKPFVFGQFKSSFVFGLPGNPLSSFVCMVRLCSRLIGRLVGGTTLERWTRAPLAAPVPANGVREFYQPALLEGAGVTPLQWKGSADIYTLARANGLILRPEHSPALDRGQVVQVLEVPS